MGFAKHLVPGSGYDEYGKGKTLDIALLEPSIAAHQLVAFFPSTPSKKETDARRGCVALAPQGDLAQKLPQLPS